MLAQDDSDGKERVIAYGGKTYLKYQRNYAITEKEMLAAYLGVMHFDFYLRHSDFDLITDHSALLSLLTKQQEVKGKFARWAAELMAYNFQVKYKEGKKLLNADALSRMTHHDVVSENQSRVMRLAHEQVETPVLPDMTRLLDESVGGEKLSVDQIKLLQTSDDDISLIVKVLKKSVEISEAETLVRYGVKLNDFYLCERHILWYKDRSAEKDGRLAPSRLVINGKLAKKVLKVYHSEISGCHFGIDKTIACITANYYWPYMLTDIAEYVATCETCQKFKIGKGTKSVPVGFKEEPLVGELLVMDICGPLKMTATKNCHILCMMDYASRFIRLSPIEDCSAATVARAYHNDWVCVMGAPQNINSDRGPAFISQ